MKILLILISLINICWAKGDFGAGLIIGNPTGFSFNHFLDKESSIDGAIAFDVDDKFEILSTYLIRNNAVLFLDDLPLDFYYGFGVKYENHDKSDDFYLGPRVPAGLSHQLRNAPVEIALEIAGFYSLIEDVDFDLEFGLIGRYYF